MTTAVTNTGGKGMTATAKVDMAAIMTGADTGIMKTATATGFMRRRQAFILRLQSRASGCFFHRSILIPEEVFVILLETAKRNEKGTKLFSFEWVNEGAAACWGEIGGMEVQLS